MSYTKGAEAPEHRSWRGMVQRCSNPNHNRHGFYKNVKVCEQWQGRTGFKTFLSDMGPRPSSNHSIDRIDNGGDYTPENCRWATPKQQARNRRSTELLTIAGVTKSLAKWAEDAGIKYWTLYRRIKVFGMEPVIALQRGAPDRHYKKQTLSFAGVTKTLSEWSRETGINYTTLRARVKRGLSPEEALRKVM
jgi:hypothetical protein